MKKEKGGCFLDCRLPLQSASQTFCLAAFEKGIGSVILGIFDQDKIESLLQIPEDRELVALIPIGYAVEAPAAPKRKPVDDLLSFIS